MQNWLSLDWGTTSFRLRLIENDVILAEVSDFPGIALVNQNFNQSWPPLAVSEREYFFLDVIFQAVEKLAQKSGKALSSLPIVSSGMISSSIGLLELEYAPFPINLDKPDLKYFMRSGDKNLQNELLIISGNSTDNDVMRGEETMLIGSWEIKKKNGVLVFPGTHCKHVFLENGIAGDFKTFMTGEVFSLFSDNSILSNSVKASDFRKYKKFFLEGVADSRLGEMLNLVFHVRTKQLFKKLNPEENYQYLSGLIIGSEVKNLTAETIMLICGGSLENQYKAAIEFVLPDAEHIKIDATQALIMGQKKIAEEIDFPGKN